MSYYVYVFLWTASDAFSALCCLSSPSTMQLPLAMWGAALATTATVTSVAANDAAAPPPVVVSVSPTSGVYTVSVGGVALYQSPAAGVELCVRGRRAAATLTGQLVPASGHDSFGRWNGTTASYTLDKDASSVSAGAAHVDVTLTFQHYADLPGIAVATASFPSGLDTSGCGANTELSTGFPSFDTSAARAASLHTLSWRGEVISKTVAALGLEQLGANGLDCGPVVSTDPDTGHSLVWSTLSSHKIVPQQTQVRLWPQCHNRVRAYVRSLLSYVAVRTILRYSKRSFSVLFRFDSAR